MVAQVMAANGLCPAAPGSHRIHLRSSGKVFMIQRYVPIDYADAKIEPPLCKVMRDPIVLRYGDVSRSTCSPHDDPGRPCPWQLRSRPRSSSTCRRSASDRPALPFRGCGSSAASLQVTLLRKYFCSIWWHWFFLPSHGVARKSKKVGFSLKPILISKRMRWSRAA